MIRLRQASRVGSATSSGTQNYNDFTAPGHDARMRVEELELDMLAITEQHILSSVKLPRHHNDPFDRLLIAQANQEGMPILSSDRLLPRYDVTVIWD